MVGISCVYYEFYDSPIFYRIDNESFHYQILNFTYEMERVCISWWVELVSMMFCFWFRKTNKLLRKDLDTNERKENNVKINRVSFYWAIQNLELGSFKYYLVDYLYWNIKVLNTRYMTKSTLVSPVKMKYG